MKQLLLLLTINISIFSVAQGWRPYQINNGITQYLSEDSTNFYNTNLFGFVFPILSVEEDTSYYKSQALHIRFEKGISPFYVGIYQTNTYEKRDLIKGQVFGDSLEIYQDSSIFYTIDSLGFTLNFPHKYKLYDSLIIGKSLTHKIIAKVDSFKVMSTFSNNDSLVFLTQYVYNNSTNTIDTTHGFHQSPLVISKAYGLYKTINYSNLDSAICYTQIRLKDTILNKEYYNYSVGDQIHSHYDSIYYIISWKAYHEISIVDSIFFSNSIKHMRFSNNRAFPSPVPVFSFYNHTTISIDTNKIFDVTNSFIIPKEHLNFASWFYNNPFSIYAMYKNRLIKFRSGNYQFYPGINNTYDSLVCFVGSLAISDTVSYVSVGDQFYHYHNGESYSKSILYYNLSGNTWGTPYNFITSINEKLNSSEVLISPNPAQDVIFVKNKLKFTSYRIFDINNKVVLSELFSNQINIQNLKSGIYFLELSDQNNRSSIQKFIKQ